MPILYARVKSIDHEVHGAFKTYTLSMSTPQSKMLYERLKPQNKRIESHEVFKLGIPGDEPEQLRFRLFVQSFLSTDTVLGEISFPFKYIEPDFLISDTYIMNMAKPNDTPIKMTIDIHYDTKGSAPFTGPYIQWRRAQPLTERRSLHRCTMPVQRTGAVASSPRTRSNVHRVSIPLRRTNINPEVEHDLI